MITNSKDSKHQPVLLKERFWQLECEDRDPDYPGWNYDADDRFCSPSEAIEEAKRLAKKEGEFFKRFRVVEVTVVTTIDEVEVFETEVENN
jgi:hypothetical protein